jgi:SET domain-containing protein
VHEVPHYFLGVEVRPSPIHGQGLFALRDFAQGEEVMEALSEDVPLWAVQSPSLLHSMPTNINTVGQLAEGGPYVYITDLGSYVNHQRNATVGLVPRGLVWYMHALRPIRAGEELTSDYTLLPPFLIRDVAGFKEL